MTNFWKDAQVVVTGARGFVGSFLVDALIARGAHVLGMDTQVRGHNHNSYAKYLDPRQADVSVIGNCGAAFREADVVFNLAAHVGGLYHNIAHQASQFWGNMQTLAPAAMAAARCAVPVFVQISTVCVYGAGFNDPAEEPRGHVAEPEQGNAGYAWAKRMGERVCHWAFEGVPSRYVLARPTNIYGARDYFDESAHVIPALIRKCTDGRETVEVYGGGQRREFIYVQDLVSGLLTLAEYGERGEAYNLGTNGETQVSIHELAQMIYDQTGCMGELSFVEDRPTGDSVRSTDSSKANALGWKYTVGMEEGLQRTIEWWWEQ